MTIRPLLFVSVALSMSVLGARAVDAQSAHRWSLQASGLYVGVYGSAYDGLSGGSGFEAQVRYTPSAFSIGLGYQASIHKLDVAGVGDVTLGGAFIEPRYVFDIGSDRAAPYLAARLAYLSQAADLVNSGVTYSLAADGTQINGGGGVLVRLTPRVNLDLGATFGSINFKDVVVSNASQSITVTGSSGTGQNLVLRVGVSVGLGK